MTTLPARPRSSTLFDDSQSRTKTWSCDGIIGPPRLRPGWPMRPLRCPPRGSGSRLGTALRRSHGPPRSHQPREEITDQRHTLVEQGRALLDANAIRPGKADAPVALHQQNQLARIKRRLFDKL